MLRLIILSVILTLIPLIANQNPTPFEIDGLVGKRAPTFSLQDTKGGLFTYSNAHEGAVLLFFTASWSVVSQQQLRELLTFVDDTNVKIIAISVDRGIEKAKRLAEGFDHEKLQIVHDENGRLAKSLFKVFVLPTAIYIDSSGVIQRIFVGTQKWSKQRSFIQ